jgi:replicative DNA helicase/5S rRNA maturation endonuclease (ribonuclease M5)
MMYKLRNLDALRDQIRLTCRLEDVAQKLYGIKLSGIGGDDFKGLCPFHDEKTPSFGISSSRQVYHCFGCKEGGDLFKFVQKMDNIEHIEAVRKLAEFGGVDLSQYSVPTTEEDRAREALFTANFNVAEQLADPDVEPYTDWLERRRLNRDALKAFGVGYSYGCPDGPAELGFDRTGQWENVIVVPVRDAHGRVAGFRNRPTGVTKIKVVGPKKEHPLDMPPLYGLYEAKKYIRASGTLILVEGEPDVWQMAAHGYCNVASTYGTQLGDDALAALDGIGVNRVIVMADNDEPGREFARRVAESRIGHKVSVKIARLSGNGKDPDEILLADGTGPIDQAIASATYAFEYVIATAAEQFNLSKSTERLDFLNEIKPKLVHAPEIEKSLAAKMLGGMLDLDDDIIADFFKEAEDAAVLQNIYGERCVLKRMLTDDLFVGEALTHLHAKDFFLSRHRVLFDEIGKLYRSQGDISPDILTTVIENKHGQQMKGVVFSVMDITSADGSSAGFFLGDLKDKSIRRTIRDKATEAIKRLGDTKQDAKHVIQNLSASISASVVSQGGGVLDVRKVVTERMGLLSERMADPNAIVGFDLGADFAILNNTLHGLQTGRYVIISAPTGVGKTAFAGCLAKRLAVDLSVPSLYLTFETGTETLADRIISSISGVPSDKVLTGFINAAEVEAVQDAASQLAASPLSLTESGVAYEECIAIIRNDVLRRGTKVVFVDYIQLMYSTDREVSSQRRDQELGHISRGFLNIAKELDIVLVALAQHNRESAKSGSTAKESIGESYKIIQDADVGIFFREKSKEEIDADGKEKGNRIMELAKHRHGRGGVITNVIFDAEVMRMFEYRFVSSKPRPRADTE